MSELQDYYNEFKRAFWADRNPSKCGCKGSGFALSDVGTWHRCPLHGEGVPHPESGETDLFQYAYHHLRINREAYAGFMAQARRAGFKGSFRTACLVAMMKLNPRGTSLTPEKWVDAAEIVAADAQAALADAEASVEAGRGW